MLFPKKKKEKTGFAHMAGKKQLKNKKKKFTRF